jgi:hypothetical protein
MLMQKMRANFSLVQEAFAGKGIMNQIGAHNLNSHLAPKGRKLMSQVDLAHTTHIYTPDKLIIAEATGMPSTRTVCLRVGFFVNGTVLFFHI